MKTNRILTLASAAVIAVAFFALTGCKSGGMAVTKHGQFLKININHPSDLPEQARGTSISSWATEGSRT